jgi:hypothetical protein
MDGIVEPVFPEADPYPAYREFTPILKIEERAAPEMGWIESYVREALKVTGTQQVR